MATIPNIVPISDLRRDASGLVKRVIDSLEPVFIAQRGRAAVVMLSMQTYTQTQQTPEVLQMFARGETSLKQASGLTWKTFLRKRMRFWAGYLPAIGDEIGSGRMRGEELKVVVYGAPEL